MERGCCNCKIKQMENIFEITGLSGKKLLELGY